MHSKRLNIFALLCAIVSVICISRLAYIQLNPNSAWQSQLEKLRRGAYKPLPALRGKITDRKGNILAEDQAKFTLCIDYKYARLADDRFWKAQTLSRLKNADSYEEVTQQIKDKYAEDFGVLFDIIEKMR